MKPKVQENNVLLDELYQNRHAFYPDAKRSDFQIEEHAKGKHSSLYTVTCRRGTEKDWYMVKSYHQDKGLKMAQEEGRTLEAWEPFFRDTDQFQIPRPVRLNEKSSFLVTKYLRSVPLVSVIRRSRWSIRLKAYQKAQDALMRVGQWLSYFQEKTRRGTSSKAHVNTCREDIDRLVSECIDCGESVETFSEIGNAADVYFKNVKTTGPHWDEVGLHRDFAPWNIQVRNDCEICVFDFYTSGFGNRYDDVSMFLANLNNMRCDFLESDVRIRGFAKAFLAGFGDQHTDESLLALFYVRNLLRVFKWRLQGSPNEFLSGIRDRRRLNQVRDLILEINPKRTPDAIRPHTPT